MKVNNQLQLFMRPQEIMEMVTESTNRVRLAIELTDLTGEETEITMEQMWQIAKDEAGNFLFAWYLDAESIEKEGVNEPIHIICENKGRYIQFVMADGHHRVVSALAAEEKNGKEQWIPVHYTNIKWRKFPRYKKYFDRI